MTTEQLVNLHKHDRWVQRNTYEFTKMVSLVLCMRKMFLIFLTEIIFWLLGFNVFFYFVQIIWVWGNEDIFSHVKSFFFFFVLLEDIFFICINCSVDCIYDNFKLIYYFLLECMNGLFIDTLLKFHWFLNDRL